MGSINDHIRENILPGESISINDRMIAYFARQFLGDGSPEAAVTAPIGSTYIRRDGGVGTTFYVKESGAGNTGWASVTGLDGSADQTITGDWTFDATVRFKQRTWFGNATESSFTDLWRPTTSSDDVRQKIIEFFGQGGDVVGTPQARGLIAKFFNKTTEDSAQADSSGAFLVDSGIPFTQTLPLVGFEGDAIVQGDNTLTNKAIGVVGAAEAQNTAEITSAFPFYAAAKGARDAGSVVSFWAGFYAEDPSTGSLGTITDKAGFYSKPRIQSETGLVLGSTQATTTAAMKGTTLHIVGTNTAGNPAGKVVKKAGSTDDVFQWCDSGAQPQVLINGNGQLFIKTAGTAHSAGSSVGAMLGMGNITTAPSVNYSGGAGAYLYVDGGVYKMRTGGGIVWNFTQQAGVADPSGGAIIDAEARAALISVITALETIGALATV